MPSQVYQETLTMIFKMLLVGSESVGEKIVNVKVVQDNIPRIRR